MHDLRDVGGTAGGLGHFLIGVALACLGGYLLFDRVTVTGGYWSFYGSADRSFGITLLPVLFGVGTLFYNGKSIIGWILMAGGLLMIVAGIIANLRIHFQPTSLVNTLIILFTLAAGLGLIVRSLAPVGRRER